MAITKIQSESLNLADTYAFTGTVTGAGGVNTPAFEAFLSTTQTISHDTETKITFNSEVYDTDGCYDNSTNYRFTPTTAGKYFVYGNINAYCGAASNTNSVRAIFKKNGTAVKYIINDFRNNPAKTIDTKVSFVVDMNGTSDYLELHALVEYSSSNTIYINGSSNYKENAFGAYRIIE